MHQNDDEGVLVVWKPAGLPVRQTLPYRTLPCPTLPCPALGRKVFESYKFCTKSCYQPTTLTHNRNPFPYLTLP